MRNSKNWLLVLLCSITLSACYTSKIYVVRHAERLDQSEDTPLSSVGLERAEVLADLLINKSIDSIFVTKYQRNHQTALPLANRLGKQNTIYEAKPVSIITDRLLKMKTKNVLVVGHSDTVLEIVSGLGTKPTITKINAADYDNLFVVTINKRLFSTHKILEELSYGNKKQLR
ncbi:MAG: phosphoglycerate mutase family protein [Spirosomataceae bacterium]